MKLVHLILSSIQIKILYIKLYHEQTLLQDDKLEVKRSINALHFGCFNKDRDSLPEKDERDK